ncbi:hypothetical protein RCZ04_18170 [Capnocytophaga sp. HP1101]
MQEIKAVEVDNIPLFTYSALAGYLQRGNCSDGKVINYIELRVINMNLIADFIVYCKLFCTFAISINNHLSLIINCYETFTI